MKKIDVVFIGIILLGGCSVAPVNTSNTARSLGKDKNNVRFSLPVPGVEYERGLKESWDTGVGLEYQLEPVFNLYTKYAFINNAEKGPSLAGLLGAGLGTSVGKSRSQYLGLVTSYRYSWFEPFFSYRKNFVHWSNNVTPSEYDQLLSFIPRKTSFNYDQFDLGVNFAGEKVSFSVGFKLLVFKDAKSGLPFVDLGFVF